MHMPNNPATGMWQKIIGSYDLWGSGNVTINNGTVTMTFTAHAEDRYNFNPGNGDIATGLKDDDNGRFEVLGWAHAFNSHGTLTRTVTWSYGNAPQTTSGDAVTFPRALDQ